MRNLINHFYEVCSSVVIKKDLFSPS